MLKVITVFTHFCGVFDAFKAWTLLGLVLAPV